MTASQNLVENILDVNDATLEGQKLRLAALEGKRVLWITAPVIPAMSEQMKNNFRFAKRHGVKVIGCFESEEDKLFQIMKQDHLFDEAVFADLSCENAAVKIVEAVKEAAIVLDGIFSSYEMVMPLVGAVAELLDLPGNPSKSYKIARSKNLTREETRKAGLATPRSGVVATEDDLDQVLSEVGFPCILKTTSGAGSVGVMRANNATEAKAAFASIRSDLTTNHMLTYNPGCDACSVLVEQCLTGSEFDVDLLFWDGECVYSQVVDNWDCIPPFYLETGSLMPSKFPEQAQQAIRDYAVACVQALGFKMGCFHVEVMYNEVDGPVLIEVNARQGGGPNQTYNLEMTGVDIFANFFLALVGIPINPPRDEICFAMGDYAITSPKTGVLNSHAHMDHIKNHPNVISTQDFVKVGDNVKGLDSGFPQWISQFVVKGESPEDCERIINQLINGLEQKIDIIKPNETPDHSPLVNVNKQ